MADSLDLEHVSLLDGSRGRPAHRFTSTNYKTLLFPCEDQFT